MAAEKSPSPRSFGVRAMVRRFKNRVSRILHRFGTPTCTLPQADKPVTVEVPEPGPVSVPTTDVTREAAPAPDTIIIPDLVSHCDFSIHCNPKVETAVEESKTWLFEHGDLGEKRKNAFRGLKAGGGVLDSVSYHYHLLTRFSQSLRLCVIPMPNSINSGSVATL